MTRYEYIRIELDFGDLSELNRYSADGWRVVLLRDYVEQVDARVQKRLTYVLLERARETEEGKS
jgi:hypothetical protein